MLFSQGEKKGHTSFCLMRDKLYISSTSTESRTSLILWKLEPERLLYKYSIAIDLQSVYGAWWYYRHYSVDPIYQKNFLQF